MTTLKQMRKQVKSKGGRQRTLNAADTHFETIALIGLLGDKKDEIGLRIEKLEKRRRKLARRIEEAERSAQFSQAQLMHSATGT